VSTVGEAAVLAGALAVGVRSALDNVAVPKVAERLPLGPRAKSS